MGSSELETVAAALVETGKGILAADESTGTIEKRFASIGVESTEETRRDYREAVFTTPGIGECISGVILYDETLRQSTADGRRFADVLTRAGVIPGIKVDIGTQPLALAPGEVVTEGLDGLRARLTEYRSLGARFTKWRAVLHMGDGLPSDRAIEANAHALARYAALAQDVGLVPIVEPEVLMDGDHTIEACHAATVRTLHTVYDQLYRQGVRLEGTLLKPNMVLSGKSSPAQASIAEVAERTLAALRETVPPAVPGIVFLSGGQTDEDATAHLDAINRLGRTPWRLSFSYGRALQTTVLQAWSGQAANVHAAQQAFNRRARLNSLATQGLYSPDMETADAA